MTNTAFKPLLLDLLRQAQTEQNAFFAQLPPADLAAAGTPELWSAKDHVAHLTFWRQRLALRLHAILRQEPQPESKDWQEMNPIIFEQHRHDTWATLLTASDQAYDELIALAAQLAEDDLTAFNRFDWTGDGMPLYTSFMGNCYEHTQIHLAQYLLDRHDLAGALATYAAWANRIIEAEVPDTLRGYMLYNLACFYATHERIEQARPALRRAFTLFPTTRTFAQTDSDLTALRAEFAN